jgi:hypothetical protein
MAGPPLPPSINAFRDALGFAMALADEYAFTNAAVLLAGDGRPIDLAVADGIGGSIEPVVAWAAGSSWWTQPPRSSLVFSIRPYEPDLVRERDLRRYRHARWSLAQAGCDLLDWIETDGDLFRSYAYLISPAEAWSDDPPPHRLGDRRPS